MVIYMRHSIHGTKVACSEAEARYDESKGWSRYDTGALMAPEKVATESELIIPTIVPASIDELETLRAKWEDKYGKPPHHRKTVKRLQREIG